ncbi:unnamed protein product [Calicophoron daubneyi]|uniref:Queuine tRNA-ribosyltransferase accessory subunit 2 n=1 Tax=Calicophoron daubneyi TaxID=300641 RepID=A0AAV2T3N8_CALDB
MAGVRFTFTSLKSSDARLGQIISVWENTELSMRTPNSFLYTRYGSVPFLPADIYESIELLPTFAFFPMFYIAEKKSVLKKFKHGVGKFCGLGNKHVFLFQTDPVDPAPVSAADRISVPVWATGGRIQLSIQDYAQCTILAAPQAFQAPTDNETGLSASASIGRKRCTKSAVRTGGYLEKTLEIRRQSADLKRIPMFVSIAGGNDLECRLGSIQHTDFSVASGVVLDGFCDNSLEDKDRSPSDDEVKKESKLNLLPSFFELLPTICKNLPSHLPRFLTGVWKPSEIAAAVQCGIDLFDGSLPYRLTRSGIGWIYSGWDIEAKSACDEPYHPHSQPPFLLFPLEESVHLSQEDVYTTPLQPGCECFACKHHTRGYISHLHIVKEMLAPMLLMIHNSHQYYRFLEDLRRSAEVGQIERFTKFAERWEFPPEVLAVDKTNESKSFMNSSADGNISDLL